MEWVLFENALGGAETRASGFLWVVGWGREGSVKGWKSDENMIEEILVAIDYYHYYDDNRLKSI